MGMTEKHDTETEMKTPTDSESQQDAGLTPEQIATDLVEDLQPKPSNGFTNFLKEWVPSILIAVALWYVLQAFVIQQVLVPTGSMKPTIVEGDRIMILKFLYFDDLEHGDIVVFYPPVKGKEDVPYIKRLVGLPGDKVETKDGILYRNGKKVNENYLRDPQINYTVDFGTVPEGSYLFLGDNRNESADASTHFTSSPGDSNWQSYYVKDDKIIGKALFRIFPVDRFGAVKRLDQPTE
jgi:signal peptidase I